MQWRLEPSRDSGRCWRPEPSASTLVELAATDEEPGWVRASWTVTVRITDDDAARKLARSICAAGGDAARAEIDAGFAAAWNRAAAPYAPMHQITGITWTPAGFEVTHLVHRSTQKVGVRYKINSRQPAPDRMARTRTIPTTQSPRRDHATRQRAMTSLGDQLGDNHGEQRPTSADV
ncbi:MAG: hypothetical protein L0I24_22235, partial [Pseudonocardia sp.]|nr:hypothetical protein [Pseudonocardia sp.]